MMASLEVRPVVGLNRPLGSNQPKFNRIQPKSIDLKVTHQPLGVLPVKKVSFFRGRYS